VDRAGLNPEVLAEATREHVALRHRLGLRDELLVEEVLDPLRDAIYRLPGGCR
jgi:hypothetical protein